MAVSTMWITVFVPVLVGVVEVCKDVGTGDGILSSPGVWDFYIVYGGVDPEDHRFRPRFV